MRGLLSILAILIIVAAGFRSVANADDAPATQPTTQPMVVLTSLYVPNLTSSLDVGQPRVVGMLADNLEPYIAVLRTMDAAAMIDYEPAQPSLSAQPMGKIATTKAKGPLAEIDEWSDQCRALCLRVRAALPTRRILVYTNWPYLRGPQYQDQLGTIVDSRRLAKTGAFEFADGVAVSVYLWPEPKMSAADAGKITANVIVAAQAAMPEGKSLVIVLATRWMTTSEPLPDDVLQAQIDAIRSAGLTECLVWGDSPEADARAQAARLIAMASRRPPAPIIPTTRKAA